MGRGCAEWIRLTWDMEQFRKRGIHVYVHIYISVYIYIYIYIQGVSGGIVNMLGGGSMD